MVLNFDLNLKQAKEKIGFTEQKEFIIYQDETVRTYETSDEWLEKFASAQNAIVDIPVHIGNKKENAIGPH